MTGGGGDSQCPGEAQGVHDQGAVSAEVGLLNVSSTNSSEARTTQSHGMIRTYEPARQ